MSDSPLISIVAVAYNSAEQIGTTITHLERVTDHLDVEIIVVDNASTDTTVQAAEKALRRGAVVESATNLGFGQGANLGIEYARGTYVVVMNDDVLPDPEAIEQLMAVLASDPTIGMVGPRMCHPDGSPAPATRRHLPGLLDELDRIRDTLFRSDLRSQYPTGTQPVDVGLLICAFVMARSDVLASIGGFNREFFIYGEDIDLCARLHSHGLRTVTVPDARAVHDQAVAPDRRIAGRDFMQRILDARSKYYRIWLSGPERFAVHVWRAFGVSDQPFRLRYHLREAMARRETMRALRTPAPLRRPG